MSAANIAGYVILCLPLVAIFLWLARTEGIKAAVYLFLVAALIIGVVSLGAYLSVV